MLDDARTGHRCVECDVRVRVVLVLRRETYWIDRNDTVSTVCSGSPECQELEQMLEDLHSQHGRQGSLAETRLVASAEPVVKDIDPRDLYLHDRGLFLEFIGQNESHGKIFLQSLEIHQGQRGTEPCILMELVVPGFDLSDRGHVFLLETDNGNVVSIVEIILEDPH